MAGPCTMGSMTEAMRNLIAQCRAERRYIKVPEMVAVAPRGIDRMRVIEGVNAWNSYLANQYV